MSTDEETQAAEAQPTVEEEVAADEAATTPEPEDDFDPVADAERRAQEYLELAQRKQAEFENFRKRMAAQGAAAEVRGVVKVAKELLAPLDHLGLAIDHADEAAREPLESLRRDFLGALRRVGVEAFAPLGEAFDPNLHEAMATAPVEDAESGTVTEVYQAGYRVGDTVVRAARVVVAA